MHGDVFKAFSSISTILSDYDLKLKCFVHSQQARYYDQYKDHGAGAKCGTVHVGRGGEGTERIACVDKLRLGLERLLIQDELPCVRLR